MLLDGDGRPGTAGRTIEDDAPAEAAPGFAGYRLNLEGQVMPTDTAQRVLFSANLILTTNRSWQEFNVRINVQRNVVAIRSLASEQTLHLRLDSGREVRARNQTGGFGESRGPGAGAGLAVAGGIAGPVGWDAGFFRRSPAGGRARAAIDVGGEG